MKCRAIARSQSGRMGHAVMKQLPRLNREVAETSRSFAQLRVTRDLPERAVQFGTGAFLRGFIDDFLHRANERGLFNGRVVAVGSTGSKRDQALREQDG